MIPLLPALGVSAYVTVGVGVLAEAKADAPGFALAAIIGAIGTASAAILAGLVQLIGLFRPPPEERKRSRRKRTPAQLRRELSRLEHELANLEDSP